MKTLYILTQTKVDKRFISKIGYFVTTDRTQVAIKAQELGITSYSIETYQADTNEAPFRIEGINDITDGQIFEFGFFLSRVDNPQADNENIANEYVNNTLVEIILDKRPFPVVSLDNNIVNHPFVQSIVTNPSMVGELYDFGDTTRKAILPIKLDKLVAGISTAKTQEFLDTIKAELTIFTQVISGVLKQFKLAQLNNSTLTETEFLSDPTVQASMGEAVSNLSGSASLLPTLLSL